MSDINTNKRLFDLVRYQRSELHAEGLITDEEYFWLCAEADMAKGGGSPSPRRLEDYDEKYSKFKEELAAVTDERDALKHALIELEAAAEAYAADQSRATDSRCGLVQPITVEDGNRLLSALRIANELSALPRLGGEL